MIGSKLFRILRSSLVRLTGEEVRLSPSQAFKYGIGIELCYGFQIGLMRRSINVIERKRSKYKLIHIIEAKSYIPFGPNRLKEIDEYYDFW